LNPEFKPQRGVINSTARSAVVSCSEREKAPTGRNQNHDCMLEYLIRKKFLNYQHSIKEPPPKYYDVCINISIEISSEDQLQSFLKFNHYENRIVWEKRYRQRHSIPATAHR
jgi:hypothetical protein